MDILSKEFANNGGIAEVRYQEGDRAELGMTYGFCTVCGAHRTTFTEFDGRGNVMFGMVCSGPDRHEGW